MKNLKARYGDWALVTGGTSGIGAELVRRFAKAGMNIVLVARTQTALDAMASAVIRDHKVEVRCVAADLSQPGGTDAVIEATRDIEIGLMVPCAAIENSGYFIDRPLAEQMALVQMDVVAPMVLTHHFGAAMARRGRGGILLVSSMSGWMPQPYMANYGAAKAYILSLGAALYEEMKDKGVDVSVLSPGPTDTPMAAGTGIDFESMGMKIMKPGAVADIGIAALGKRGAAIAGVRNKMMAFMMIRLMPRQKVGGMFKKMMGKALGMGVDVAMGG